MRYQNDIFFLQYIVKYTTSPIFLDTYPLDP
jgi:hypothetical protein